MRQIQLGLDLKAFKEEAAAFTKGTRPALTPQFGTPDSKLSETDGTEVPLAPAANLPTNAALDAAAAAFDAAKPSGATPTAKAADPAVGASHAAAKAVAAAAAASPADAASAAGTAGTSLAGVDASALEQGSAGVQLWPVPPPAVPPTPFRPLHAGQYSVLVVDEPSKKLRVASRASFRMSRSSTLLKTEEDTDYTANRDWLEESDKEKSVHAAAEGTAGISGAVAAAKSFFRAEFIAGSSDEEEFENEVVRRLRVVDSTFSRIFGDDFDRVVPLYDTRAVDASLTKLQATQAKRDRLVAALAAEGLKPEKAEKLAAKLEAIRAREADLQAQYVTDTDEALNRVPCQAFVAVFHTAKAATMASALDLNPVNWRAFHILPGIDPEAMNWHALQVGCVGSFNLWISQFSIFSSSF